MKIMPSLTVLMIILIFGVVPAFAEDAEEKIKGHYCYTYGDNESLVEAREFARTMATKNAIESYNIFAE